MTADQRVTMLDLDAARARAVEHGVPESMAELSVFRIALHQPAVAAALYGMLDALLLNGILDARLRELIIMRIGWATGSEYEWTQHWRVALLLGVAEHDLLAVRDWQHADQFGEIEHAVLAATDETLQHGSISDATWARCREALGNDPAIMVELVAAIGNWRMFSILLRALDVPLENGVEGWPPDRAVPS